MEARVGQGSAAGGDAVVGAEGAQVVLADLNVDLAARNAAAVITSNMRANAPP